MKRRISIAVAGLLVVVASAGVIYPLAWQQHEKNAAHVDIERIEKNWAHLSTRASPPDREAPAYSCVPQPGPGILRIPSLGVTAPVEQGTSDVILSQAVGHLPSSPWPGQIGAAELLGHDVGFFASDNDLRPGDVVTYETRCDLFTFRVLAHYIETPGQSIPAPSEHGIALISCWPPNALWWTPERLIVTAALIHTTSKKTTTQLDLTAQRVDPLPPEVPAQPFLFNDGWLAGTMTVVGADASWKNGPVPLRWASIGLDALAAVHFGLRQHASWLSSLAPGVAVNPVFADDPSDVPVTVTEKVHANRLDSMTLSTALGGRPVEVIVVPRGRWSVIEKAGTK